MSYIRVEKAKHTCYLGIDSGKYSIRPTSLDTRFNYLVLLKCILYSYVILKTNNVKSG